MSFNYIKHDHNSTYFNDESLSNSGVLYDKPPRKSVMRYSRHDIITSSKKGSAAVMRMQQMSLEIDMPGMPQACLSEQVQSEVPLLSHFQSIFRPSLHLKTDSELKAIELPTRLPETQSSNLTCLKLNVNNSNDVGGLDTSVFSNNTESCRIRHGMPSKKSRMDREYNTNKMRNKADCKVKAIRAAKHSKRRPLEWKYILLLPMIPLILLFGLCWIILNGSYIPHDACSMPLDLSAVKQALQINVVGQEKAINQLIYIFTTYQSTEQSQPPVILISGGNGVGKSLVSSILSRTFPLPGMTQLVVPPLPSPVAIIQTFGTCGQNLLVIDDLTPRLATDAIKWIQKFSHEANFQNKKVWIMLIFNVQTWHENLEQIKDDKFHIIMEQGSKLLYDSFCSSEINRTELIHFPPLKHQDIQECIHRALQIYGLPTEGKDFIKSLTQIRTDHHEGCKRVQSQVAALVKPDFI